VLLTVLNTIFDNFLYRLSHLGIFMGV